MRAAFGYWKNFFFTDLNAFQQILLTFSTNMGPAFNNTFNNVYNKINEFENMNGNKL